MARDLTPLDKPTQGAVRDLDDPSKSIYPHNKCKVTSIGHKWEMNETPDNEYINIRHGLTGAYFKLMTNGDIQVHSPSNNINIIAAKNIEIKTGTILDTEQKDRSDRMDINVIGNAHFLVEGDTHFHTKGDRYDKVDGNYFLTVGNRMNIVSPDIGILSDGTFQLNVNEMKTDGSRITTKVLDGGEVRFDLLGGFIVNQISPLSGTISFSTLGNFEVDVGQNVVFNVGGANFNPLQPAFAVNCAVGGISMNALLGASNFFAGGPYLDVDCLAGVYLN